MDTTTGLSWTAATYGPATYPTAALACTTNATGGYQDWRLPTRAELLSLVDFNRASWMADDSLSGQGKDGCFWTGQPSHTPNNPWCVNFDGGCSFPRGAMLTCNIRCVRGQPSTPQLAPAVERYTVTANGAEVLDRATGLIWRTDLRTTVTSADLAPWACSGLPIPADGKVWRIPGVREVADVLDLAVDGTAHSLPWLLPAGSEMLAITGNGVVPHSDPWLVDLVDGRIVGTCVPAFKSAVVPCVR